jgi:Ca-activated chloride channel family protein
MSLWFTLTIDETREMARDATRCGALVTVQARPDDGGAVTAGSAEIVIMDRSASMQRFGKLEEAKRAVAAAIDALADGTRFAVVAGNHSAEQVYPANGLLATATAQSRREAKIRVSHFAADGGTAMSTWITKAEELFARDPDAVRHAVLYTDGINESEPDETLDAALRTCRDRFVCDVRGVGIDWRYRQLQMIADAMQGRVEAIINVADLRADFAALMEQAQRRHVPSVRLRLTLDRRFRLESITQIRPVENDLTDRRVPQDGGIVEVPLLAWGEEVRDYLVMMSVDPATLPHEKVRAARVDIVAGQPGNAVFCAEPAAITVLRLRYRDAGPANVSFTQARDLAELTETIRSGIDAYQRGGRDIAEREFTKAVAIARRLGATSHLKRLRKLVTIDEFGEVRLRDCIAPEDLLMTASHAGDHEDVERPGRPDLGGEGPEPPPVRRICPWGHETVGPVVKFCEEPGCNHEFMDVIPSDGLEGKWQN